MKLHTTGEKGSWSDWHKRQIRKFQSATGMTDYQILWLTFLKGLIIGAWLL
jgi:hypothetical protein